MVYCTLFGLFISLWPFYDEESIKLSEATRYVIFISLQGSSTRGVRTADADIRGPGSADFLADADGPRIRQTNTFADADHPRI